MGNSQDTRTVTRNGTTYQQNVANIGKRKELYETKHPETKQGVAGANASNKSQGKKHASANFSFASDTATKTGMSERAIQLSIHRADAIAPSVKDAIRDTPIADKGVDLDALAKMPEAEHRPNLSRNSP